MSQAMLEHVNLTVSDADKTAQRLERLFGWRVRWQGASLGDGYSVHVGTPEQYVALYTHEGVEPGEGRSYDRVGALNHVAVVVRDLDEVEQRVLQEGLKPHHHADYEPGRRFYFRDQDNVEYEVVSYAAKK